MWVNKTMLRFRQIRFRRFQTDHKLRSGEVFHSFLLSIEFCGKIIFHSATLKLLWNPCNKKYLISAYLQYNAGTNFSAGVFERVQHRLLGILCKCYFGWESYFLCRFDVRFEIIKFLLQVKQCGMKNLIITTNNNGYR